jgi:hypothetical protein
MELGVKTIDSLVIGENPLSVSYEKVNKLAFCAEPPQKTQASYL